ncbi:spore coat protein [Desulfosporosinus sp. BICA1-9]|uniref:spore coat protein n=1 Tax=Desulfosporosinus sp. BICA1-9 TaxID=1531958 RepID=UPI00054B2AFB|nr:spore coat protein [Desulfosporosinus sp. BICA1-9]KJS46070.1 MAG: spore coat protein F [Peptococcaceae bacterium BRH_c23]KJS90645.1 MAG: spore coat protein F [Desulfosporosinus sp. BICA1-9]
MTMQSILTEQEIVTDLLTSEKHHTSTINTFITESTCSNLRQNLKDILNEEHSIHENIYNLMNQKGWYPTSDAQAQDVQKVKDKFNSLQV